MNVYEFAVIINGVNSGTVTQFGNVNCQSMMI